MAGERRAGYDPDSTDRGWTQRDVCSLLASLVEEEGLVQEPGEVRMSV